MSMRISQQRRLEGFCFKKQDRSGNGLCFEAWERRGTVNLAIRNRPGVASLRDAVRDGFVAVALTGTEVVGP